MRHLDRIGRVLVAVGLAALLISTLVFVVRSFGPRPYSGVEAETIFESIRVAKGYPLYVDPFKGAWEDGAPPSRYYVLYTPFWSWAVGHLATPTLEGIKNLGRALSIFGWLVSQIAPIWIAEKGKRTAPAVASILGASLIFLVRNALGGTADTLAAALAALGLVRAAKLDRIDPLSAVLFTAAPFVKPRCLGIFAGAFFACVLLRRPGYLRSIGAGLATFIGLSALCHVMSGGQWLLHIVLSTGQPLSFFRWQVEFGSRCIVLGIPHAAVAIVAWRKKITWVVTLPLVTSIAWSTFSMAKLGSATNYWHEPTVAAVAAVAIMANRGVVFSKIGGALLRLATVVLTGLIAGISIPAMIQQVREYGGYHAAEAALAEHCKHAPGEAVVSDNVAFELDLNGRLIVPEWQTSFLARRGRFPLDAWRNDFRFPSARWLVLAFDVDHPPSNPLDLGRVSVYGVELRDAIHENFAFDQIVNGLYVYRHR